jgi:hypothetical protein
MATPWEQDADGRWWRRVGTKRPQRREGRERSCEACQASFICELAHDGRYCSRSCANQAYKAGRHKTGADHHRWKGGRVIDRNGYVLLRAEDGYSNGYVLEHRKVMAEHLDRPLEDYETVHHLNGDRTDNRLANLQLMISGHPKGVALRCRCCGSRDLEAETIT